MAANKFEQAQNSIPSWFIDAFKNVVYDAVRPLFENAQISTAKREIPPIFGIDICEEVTGFAKATLYRNTSKNLMPHYRRDGKLFFKRDEIYAWMTENRVLTHGEFQNEVDRKLTNKKTGK